MIRALIEAMCSLLDSLRNGCGCLALAVLLSWVGALFVWLVDLFLTWFFGAPLGTDPMVSQ